jgi:hypothetical protein
MRRQQDEALYLHAIRADDQVSLYGLSVLEMNDTFFTIARDYFARYPDRGGFSWSRRIDGQSFERFVKVDSAGSG